ncbi:UNVERIFIED_CONTAM: Retrovirus-related Pol polyprotein from transposon RE2 [Sesamum latifolium]|uniref:Retrovirus-related Pol polyprotein from transposon RE2 n=1 Tax=Sesamum latifolium TaxID=2727402 RepID=A0AAW2Y6E0_9LAMI
MANSSSTVPDASVFTSAGGSRMQTVENSGMVLISAPLNGHNWLSWSRSVRIALEGRDKIGFIDGSCVKPDEGSAEFKQWRITDSMVRTWILNTISKDIVNAYLYANSARSLWLELESRYGECDGPLLYKIQRGLVRQSKGISVLQLIIHSLNSCGMNCQILVLDPLPHVNKAFSMILRIERQRQINLESIESGEKLVTARIHASNSMEFLIGKELTDQKKRNGDGGRAYMAHEGNSVDMPITTAAAGTNLVADLMEALKLIQNKVPQDPVRVHFAQADEMAVDDYTRVTWTFLMHHKSQTVSILSSFLAKVATQFDTKVRTLRTDNGTEFLSLPCQELLHKHGINHHKTCTYTPQQNGVVERKHRHLLQGQKGYKVFDLDNRVVLVSRDVVFHESTFPYLTSDSSLASDSVILPTPIPDTVPVLSLPVPITESPSSSEQVPPPDPSPSVPPSATQTH